MNSQTQKAGLDLDLEMLKFVGQLVVDESLKHKGSFEHWSPSTDIADAWTVLSKVVDYQAASTDFNPTTGEIVIQRWQVWIGERGNAIEGIGFADTAPLAICRAVLSAMGKTK